MCDDDEMLLMPKIPNLVASHKGDAKFCWAVDVDIWL